MYSQNSLANSFKANKGEFFFERDIDNAGSAFDFIPLNRSPMAALTNIDPEQLKKLIIAAWKNVAPKRVAAASSG